MGNIFSRPKMPAIPAMPVISYTPTPSVTNKASTNEPPAGTGGSNADNAPEYTADQQREKNILTRNRGRIGTIGTSFNGIMNDFTITPTRKTLLGE